jgi:alpha-glucosidase
LLDQYPGVTTLGEIAGEDVLDIMARYTDGNDKLHSVYNFELLSDKFSARYIRGTVETLEAKIGQGWPCWSIGNHDVQRVVSRWGGEAALPEFAKMLIGLLATLRGSICIYQGEELGLTQADITYEQMQDPYGIAFWPEFKGRDGCRTPMPWNKDVENAGFSKAKTTWLPVPKEHYASAVSEQIDQADSILGVYRRFLTWRRQLPALVKGSIEFIDAPDQALLFIRQQDDTKILVCINCSDSSVNVPTNNLTLELLGGHGFSGAAIGDEQLTLPAYGVCFARVQGS